MQRAMKTSRCVIMRSQTEAERKILPSLQQGKGNRHQDNDENSGVLKSMIWRTVDYQRGKGCIYRLQSNV